MWLMQKGPRDSYNDTPSAPGSQLAVTKPLHSIAYLQIQWYPQTRIFPSLTTLANQCQFLEGSLATSLAVQWLRL